MIRCRRHRLTPVDLLGLLSVPPSEHRTTRLTPIIKFILPLILQRRLMSVVDGRMDKPERLSRWGHPINIYKCPTNLCLVQNTRHTTKYLTIDSVPIQRQPLIRFFENEFNQLHTLTYPVKQSPGLMVWFWSSSSSSSSPSTTNDSVILIQQLPIHTANSVSRRVGRPAVYNIRALN